MPDKLTFTSRLITSAKSRRGLLSSIVATVLLCSLCLHMTGCTQREITNEDVIGTWRLDDDSRKHLSGELQDCEAEMLLGRDGSLSVVAFPWPDVFSIEDCPIQLVTATGKWKIVHNVRGRTDVTLIIEHVTAGDFDELPIPHSFIYGGSGSGAYIYFYLGDPDSAPRIKFVRQEDS